MIPYETATADKIVVAIIQSLNACNSIDDIAKTLSEATKLTVASPDKTEGRWGCHLDLEAHMTPDECVIEADGQVTGRCTYADGLIKTHGEKACKWQCPYWRPIIS